MSLESGPPLDKADGDEEELDCDALPLGGAEGGDGDELVNDADVNDDADDNGAVLPAGVGLLGKQKNSVILSVKLFIKSMHDFSTYVYFATHNITRGGMADYLSQESRLTRTNTPYLLDTFVTQTVDLTKQLVDACPAGCLAFTAQMRAHTHCSACGTARFRQKRLAGEACGVLAADAVVANDARGPGHRTGTS